MENIKLNNGLVIPQIGFGVFQAAPEKTTEAVETALALGYRHIDTAAVYGNEREVGEGIRSSGVSRDDIIIETKIWVSDYGFEKTLHAFDKATRKLGYDTIDILILHQPAPTLFESTIDSYRALESLYADGRVRAIGVSNFQPEHLKKLAARAEVTPALNQIELHPYYQARKTQAKNSQRGIVSQAWSPIGGITFYPGDWSPGRVSVMDDPTLRQIADQHDKTPAQVMLRWHVQEGRSAIPKSTNAARIGENLAVFDFELSGDELRQIDALDKGIPIGPDPSSMFDIAIPEA